MPATPRQIPITDEDLQGGEGSYAAVAVNMEHRATLKDVEDYATTNTSGWKWLFDILGAEFAVFTAITKANGEQATSSRWKLIETIEAFDPEFFILGGQLAEVDPNLFVGQEVGAYVAYDYDKGMDDETWEALDPEDRPPRYRKMQRLFPLVELGVFGAPVYGYSGDEDTGLFEDPEPIT